MLNKYYNIDLTHKNNKFDIPAMNTKEVRSIDCLIFQAIELHVHIFCNKNKISIEKQRRMK